MTFSGLHSMVRQLESPSPRRACAKHLHRVVFRAGRPARSMLCVHCASVADLCAPACALLSRALPSVSCWRNVVLVRVYVCACVRVCLQEELRAALPRYRYDPPKDEAAEAAAALKARLSKLDATLEARLSTLLP